MRASRYLPSSLNTTSNRFLSSFNTISNRLSSSEQYELHDYRSLAIGPLMYTIHMLLNKLPPPPSSSSTAPLQGLTEDLSRSGKTVLYLQ